MQAKLRVSQPGDIYEQEADRIAEQVIRMPSDTVPRKCTNCEMKDDEELRISRKESSSGSEVSDDVTNKIDNMRGGGSMLDSSTIDVMESRFGFDFSKVRVHTDEQAARSAESVNALAYTVGNDIVFGGGQYQPNALEGRRLLAHELTHVVQQTHGTSISGSGLIQRQATRDPLCDDLLAQIIARILELTERYWAIINNPLNLPQTGPMSVGGHQQQFMNKQVNLRNMLNQWNTNNCGPGLPLLSWFWATVPVPSPASKSTPHSRTELPKDGERIPAKEIVEVGGGLAAGYIAYRVIRMLPSLLPPLWWTIPENAVIP